MPTGLIEVKQTQISHQQKPFKVSHFSKIFKNFCRDKHSSKSADLTTAMITSQLIVKLNKLHSRLTSSSWFVGFSDLHENFLVANE